MTTRLRILQVTPTLGVGGAERVVVHLASHTDRARFEVRVACLYDPLDTELEAALRSRGTHTYHLGKRRGFDPRIYLRLASVLRSFRPDVIHTHNNTLRYIYPLALVTRRTRVVHTIHNMAHREVEYAGRLLQQVAFRTGVAPVAIGASIADSIHTEYRLDAYATIPNGVPVRTYRVARSTGHHLRQTLGIPAEAPVFVTVARLTLQKNVAAVIRALANPTLVSSGAHLLLAGDGPLRTDLERLARDVGVASRVSFLGVRSDVPCILAAADVAVLASSWEGNPLAVMEAMAAGLPIIATRVGAVPELVTSGVTGILVSPGDERALAAAMIRLASAPHERATMADASARDAERAFDVRLMARRYEEVYGQLCQ